MLRFLCVDNFALIDHLEIDFEAGLNLITGETGSGKSILVDAFGLLLGARASRQMIRQGSDGARVEGLFQLSRNHPVAPILSEARIDWADGELVIRRDISNDGGNKILLNGRIAPLALLTRIGGHLGDIHGQHDQQQLLDPRSHLDFLDAYARHDSLVERVRQTAFELEDLKRRRRQLAENLSERQQRQELLSFQIDELERHDLRTGLDEELQAESRLLCSAQERQQLAQSLYSSLYENEVSLLSALGSVEHQLADLASLDSALTDAVEPTREARFQLEELAYRLRDYAEGVESNPGRLEEVELQLAAIQKLTRKYASSLGGIDEVLKYLEDARSELERLQQDSRTGDQLDTEIERLEASWTQDSSELTRSRTEAGTRLSIEIASELTVLAMPESTLEARLSTVDVQFSPRGAESAEFQLSANPGESVGPLARIASGGEISRVMLALKSILTVETHPKTLVFDEVDSGIGAGVASGLGRKLAELAARHQVFCVTHLPQIAAHADRHLIVSKSESSGRTVVGLKVLDDSQRVEELSRMLAGEKVTDAARQHALELIETAGA